MPPTRTTTVSTAKSNAVKIWRVVGQTGRVGRVHFKGNEADARDYVERNFPRAHVDEFTANPNNPVHDVKLLSPDGVEEVYHSVEGWKPRPDYDKPEDEDTSGDESEYV
jgi:hypothetical protein